MSGDITDGTSAIDGGTIVTIPAGREWVGTISIEATINAGLVAVSASPSVTVQSGSTCQPASGSVVAELVLTTPALLGVATGETTEMTTPQICIIAGAAVVTLKLNYNGAAAASATAIGYLP